MNEKKLAAKPAWQQILVVLLLFGLFLLIERQIQVYQGKRAIAASDLPETGFSEAIAKSRLSGKPVLANFSAIWCSACRRLERKVLADTRVRERILSGYHYTRLEYQQNRTSTGHSEPRSDRAWFEYFGVSGFPTLLVIDGETVRRLPLSFDAEVFLAQI